ncbi:MAG: GIY-YIG nuclease family protein [Paracoccus sp. (in: a-proteobacteria)]|nr:GIY-YIG nuclease family protein [Paracoccus sp. (in: a-proteobacteria)]
MTTSLNNEGAASPFLKTEPGKFILKASSGEVVDQKTAEDSENNVDDSIPVVKSAGIFWNASRVDWKAKPKLLGQQQAGSYTVDFSEQIGIYILYDGSRVVYLGRAVERPLGIRLAEHLKDRLNGRWDRFSWFGLRGVSETGNLTGPEFSANQKQIISLMEAILIEALEPPLNRKRGDDFSDKEYLQVTDPALEAKKKKALIDELTAKLGS